MEQVVSEIDHTTPEQEDARVRPVDRHDVDRIYSRFREQDGDIINVQTRVSAVESRLYNLEAGMIDHSGKLATIEGKVGILDHHIDVLQTGQDSLTEMVRAQTNILVQHTTEEAAQQQRQYEAIQRLSKNILTGTTVIGVLTITLVTLHQLLVGDGELFTAVVKLLGFGS